MKILIVCKSSKYEWERERFGLSHEQFVDKYKSVSADLDALLEAHNTQVSIRNSFKNIMPNAYMVNMEVLDSDIKGYDLVISLGGDDSFKFVSHYVGNIPILSLNSDPKRSDGCLTSYSISDEQSIYDLLETLDFENFSIEEWPRLKIILNGKLITQAVSEYFLGDNRRTKMSRHVLKYGGKEFKQKCSGIIISTGAGSTGWFDSAHIKSIPWDPKEKLAVYTVTELYKRGSDWSSPESYGALKDGDELIITSLNNEGGIISVDSWDEYEFIRGSEARISLGTPLNFVRPVIEISDEDIVSINEVS